MEYSRREKSYIQINVAVLRSPRLSFAAKGLFAYLMLIPDDCEITEEDFKDKLPDDEETILSAMNELIKEGYCIQEGVRTKDPKTGRWDDSKIIYTALEENTEEFKKKFLQHSISKCENRERKTRVKKTA